MICYKWFIDIVTLEILPIITRETLAQKYEDLP